eukprot:TCALIF_04245-PA protein Name:"Protein of unknown function" AED:0.17 eAED:0.17 QI:0/0/0/0.5/1/1/2/0/384
MTRPWIVGLLLIVFPTHKFWVTGRKLTDPNTNFLDNPGSSGIDFSRGEIEDGGVICVHREKIVDKTVKDQMKECFVQNVTQCYNTYITEYSDGEEEKCEDFYWKSCKIVFDQVTFNATTRKCRRPLIKNCDDRNNAVQNPDNVVCETFYETACNTTDIFPDPTDEPVPVTFCQKIPRKICAPDNCRVEEGPETCKEDSKESLVQKPVELCDLQPQKHCSVIKIAVPRLSPEKKCRQVEKEICSTSLVNPHPEEKTVFIKYCARMSDLPSSGGGYQASLPNSNSLFQPTYGDTVNFNNNNNNNNNQVQFDSRPFQRPNLNPNQQQLPTTYGAQQGSSQGLPTYANGLRGTPGFRNKRNNPLKAGSISVQDVQRRVSKNELEPEPA